MSESTQYRRRFLRKAGKAAGVASWTAVAGCLGDGPTDSNNSDGGSTSDSDDGSVSDGSDGTNPSDSYEESDGADGQADNSTDSKGGQELSIFDEFSTNELLGELDGVDKLGNEVERFLDMAEVYQIAKLEDGAPVDEETWSIKFPEERQGGDYIEGDGIQLDWSPQGYVNTSLSVEDEGMYRSFVMYEIDGTDYAIVNEMEVSEDIENGGNNNEITETQMIELEEQQYIEGGYSSE